MVLVKWTLMTTSKLYSLKFINNNYIISWCKKICESWRIAFVKTPNHNSQLISTFLGRGVFKRFQTSTALQPRNIIPHKMVNTPRQRV